MNYIDSIKQPISAEMQLFDQTFASVLHTKNELLSSINNYVLAGTGKQLRPILVMLAAALVGKINTSTIKGAISIELLHTASLIHDDIVDDTAERRGKPSVNAKWNNKVAVLAGDYMLSKSLYQATSTDNIEILKVIASIGAQLSDGELLQLANTRQSEMTEDAYFDIIRKKTALLFAACTKIGALSVDADADDLNKLYQFGELLGICFQIKDDIFDYFGNSKIGKPTGNDLRDGKVTLPLIYALKHSTGEKKEQILHWINNKDFSTQNIQEILLFANEHGGIEYAITKMEEYKNKAIDIVNGFTDNRVKKALIACAEFAAKREL